MAHGHFANYDTMGRKLLLDVRAEMGHHRSSVEGHSILRLDGHFDVLACDRIGNAYRLRAEHVRMKQGDSLDFSGKDLQSAHVEHLLRPPDNLEPLSVGFDDISGVVPAVDER